MPNNNSNKNKKKELVDLVKGFGLELKQDYSKIKNKSATNLEKEDFPESILQWFIMREFLFYYYNTNNGSNTNYVNEIYKIVKHIIPISQYININLEKILMEVFNNLKPHVEDNNEKFLEARNNVIQKISNLQK